ncbi:glycosyltransferase family 2 protein [Hyunsoonleella ulvae]|uniref:glycosyltransferase family 2 protein n=1 Tax=Hyunsoonleella ulvae TaxID=2799948 RepID=UPI00193A0E09|nr:glycosyltransferase family 2 protein [Hyunsoonleella ulvae]
MAQAQTKISALLITYNEEHHIVDVIKNIEFADEIIVIDGESTDKTVALLKEIPKVKLVSRPFKNFADQRNFAISQANYEWLLFIDADERITNALKHEILKTVTSPNGITAFMFKRLLYFKNKRVRFSGFQTDTTYRLFKNGCVKYIESKIVHEMPLIQGNSKIMQNYMLHFSFNNLEDYKLKMEHYASLKAKELNDAGKKATLFHFMFRPAYKFITNYIFRLGFLDGKLGFNICYLSAYGVWYRYKQLKILNQSKK